VLLLTHPHSFWAVGHAKVSATSESRQQKFPYTSSPQPHPIPHVKKKHVCPGALLSPSPQESPPLLPPYLPLSNLCSGPPSTPRPLAICPDSARRCPPSSKRGGGCSDLLRHGALPTTFDGATSSSSGDAVTHGSVLADLGPFLQSNISPPWTDSRHPPITSHDEHVRVHGQADPGSQSIGHQIRLQPRRRVLAPVLHRHRWWADQSDGARPTDGRGEHGGPSTTVGAL
jgi:hypothetical protein